MEERFNIKYMRSFLAFYLKGFIKLDKNILTVRVPNVKWTFIPCGKRTFNVPINQIASVDVYTEKLWRYKLISIFMCMYLMFFLDEYSPNYDLIILRRIIVTACIVLNLTNHVVCIFLTSGQVIEARFSVFEKKKARKAAWTILESVANRMDDTNVREQTDRTVQETRNQTNILIEAISKLKE